jgi:hypothetical protein
MEKKMGECNPNTGECKYAYETQCYIGCDPDTKGCTKGECEIKGCPDRCENGAMKKWGNCSKTTGKCDYLKSTPCPLGCDPATNDCKQKTCDEMECPDACSQQDNKIISNMTGMCVTVVDEPACQYRNVLECQPDGCNQTTGHCIEACDNGKDDDGDEKMDCADPDCAGSISCACYKMGTSGSMSIVKEGSPETPSGKLNVIFIGANYGPNAGGDKLTEKDRNAEFVYHVNKAIEGFKQADPFSSNLANINFYATKSDDPAYHPVSVGLNRCNAGAPGGKDQYMILDYTKNFPADGCGEAALCGGLATAYSRGCHYALRETVLHEFGHSFGCLWDEYSYGTRANPFNYASYTVHADAYPAANCYAGPQYNSGAGNCTQYFGLFEDQPLCWSGCTSPGWQRSSKYSIMWDGDTYRFMNVSSGAETYFKKAADGTITLPWFYNTVSQKLIQMRLQSIIG